MLVLLLSTSDRFSTNPSTTLSPGTPPRQVREGRDVEINIILNLASVDISVL